MNRKPSSIHLEAHRLLSFGFPFAFLWLPCCSPFTNRYCLSIAVLMLPRTSGLVSRTSGFREHYRQFSAACFIGALCRAAGACITSGHATGWASTGWGKRNGGSKNEKKKWRSHFRSREHPGHRRGEAGVSRILSTICLLN